MLIKHKCVISCPIDTYSGYGSRSRDFVKALIQEYPLWDIKILPQRWGTTREGFLQDHQLDLFQERLITSLTFKPDIWIQITVPNEFQPLGTFNIGITAGIETDRADSTWIEGCNRMSLVLVSSQHSKTVFEQSKYNLVDPKGNPVGNLEIKTPIQVLFEGVDTSVYTAINASDVRLNLDAVQEKNLLLVVGHWLQGSLWQDRKNIGATIKTFLETYKNKGNAPGLLLKVQRANASILDRDTILDKISEIKNTVKGKLPNIYLLHGEVSDSEMNDLYNHPKVKAMISLTKGEGFGRPLLEFSMVGKPIIATNWSGHLDFLNPKHTKLIQGTLEPIHKSAVVDKTLVEGSRWFSPNLPDIGQAYLDLFKNYQERLVKAKRQANSNREAFSLEQMGLKLRAILDDYVAKIPVQLDIKLPKLTKIN
jgi:glycosyltransferase involved in cell wall biosynthesis